MTLALRVSPARGVLLTTQTRSLRTIGSGDDNMGRPGQNPSHAPTEQARRYDQSSVRATAMTLVLLVACLWLSGRTLLLLAQVGRHTPEAKLGREFQRELRERGLIAPEQVESQP